jgi:trimethylamine--corrinoid protein Co-methyltransferase
MRPKIKFLDDRLIDQIISEAMSILCEMGVEIHNEQVLSMLGDHGVAVRMDTYRAVFNEEIINNALEAAPSEIKLYDVLGNEAVDLSGDNVNYTPGSAAINILDYETNKARRPNTADYIKYARLMNGLEHIASQSTAFIPSDVEAKISDSYRLFLSLMYCEKPVVTGTFTIEAFEIMKNLQLAVRGSAEDLAAKPLTIFSCCPTSPIKWSDVTSQNLIDCAKYMIPVEYISMPLAGFMAPVTLVGTLVQHTAETLSGLIISQVANPGAPALYGGSPAIFDMRYETTPMGAIETQMIDCAYSEIGKYLSLPTQAYIGLSDAKLLDAQAGLETSNGAILASLAGINNISGPGMLDFESCTSLEKLVLDNQICGMTKRMLKGIEPKDDFPIIPLMEELLRDQHLLISGHTLEHIHDEHFMPSPVIDRAQRSRWEEEGSLTLRQRAHNELENILVEAKPSELSDSIKTELVKLMEQEAKRYGMDKLPERAE